MRDPKFIEFEGQRLRSVTLDEWMMALDNDHPARLELGDLRRTAMKALEAVDKLERENVELAEDARKLQAEIGKVNQRNKELEALFERVKQTEAYRHPEKRRPPKDPAGGEAGDADAGAAAPSE